MKQKHLIPFILLGLLISACSSAGNTATATQEAIPTVLADDMIIAEGRLEPGQFAEIAFSASGVISEVLVEEGQSVKVGDPLVQLGDESDTNYAAAQLELVTAQQALNDLVNSSGTGLAQVVIDLREAQEEFDEAEDYLSYLQTSKKIPQTETRRFLI